MEEANNEIKDELKKLFFSENDTNIAEQTNMDEVNNAINDELEKLIESMSGLSIEHKKTLSICYAEYFEHKVHLFLQIEKQIRLLIQLFTSRAKDFKELRISGDVNKFREEFSFIIKESFDYTKVEGFGIDRCRKYKKKAKKPATAKSDMKSASQNGDHFCDYILKEDNCDKGIEMVGYGLAYSEGCSTKNVKAPKKNKPNTQPIKSEVTPTEMEVNPTESDVTPFESDVTPIEIDEENPIEFQETTSSYQNSKYPPRLRFKKNLSSILSTPVPLQPDDSNADDIIVKRKRFV